MYQAGAMEAGEVAAWRQRRPPLAMSVPDFSAQQVEAPVCSEMLHWQRRASMSGKRCWAAPAALFPSPAPPPLDPLPAHVPATVRSAHREPSSTAAVAQGERGRTSRCSDHRAMNNKFAR